MSFYVVVTDPTGACLEGEPLPITTRILFERGQAYGFENLQHKVTKQERPAFLAALATQKTGTHGRFTWERE